MLSFKRILGKLAVQKNTSPHIGAIINAYGATGVLFTPLTLLGVTTTVYGLWGQEIIRRWFPWFNFTMLLACMVIFVLVMMVFFYKVVVPSSFAFTVQQNYKHRNPLVADVKSILKKLDNIEKRIKKLEKEKEE